MNTLKHAFELQPHTHIQLATSDFQSNLLLLTSYKGRYQTLILTSESTSYIYAIMFFAGLNSVQGDQVNRENDKQTSTYIQLHILANLSQLVMHVFSSLGVA